MTLLQMRILGGIMVGFPLGCLVIFACVKAGWRPALAIIGGVTGLVALIVVGVKLLLDGQL